MKESDKVSSYAAAKMHLRALGWKGVSQIPIVPRRHLLYAAKMRRIGDFRDPRLFTELINWRILNDRSPRLGVVCDKLAAKSLAQELTAGTLLVPATLWAGENLRDVPADLWTRDWVLKPNHSSARVLFSPRGDRDLTRLTRGWLEADMATRLGEWGYAQAQRLLLLEERIPGYDEALPRDYKFYCFHGEPRIIQVNSGRFSREATETNFSPAWEILSMRDPSIPTAEETEPPHLIEMLRHARTLSAGWDFLRVDLYDTPVGVWFGEFSPYPGGGRFQIVPRFWDQTLGEWWRAGRSSSPA